MTDRQAVFLDSYERGTVADLVREYVKGLQRGDITVGGPEANVEEIETMSDVLNRLEG
jgi:hypothetical protein